MTANTPRTRTTTTIAFRVPIARRLMLEAIQHERGHGDLSVTLREAVDEYIDGHLRRPKGSSVSDQAA